MRHISRLASTLAAFLLVGALALGVGACGDGDDGGSGGGASTEAVEKAFLTGMTHHHETAIEMAEIAQQRGQTPFVKGLAEDIVSTQEREMAEMRKIYTRLLGGELKPDPGAHAGLGLSAEGAGMTHTPATNEMLKAADPFDRAFVDEMEPHHTGAVKMAEVVLESTKDADLRKLAEGIISTQTREIEEMNTFRTEKYGAPVPEMEMKGGGTEHEGH